MCSFLRATWTSGCNGFFLGKPLNYLRTFSLFSELFVDSVVPEPCKLGGGKFPSPRTYASHFKLRRVNTLCVGADFVGPVNKCACSQHLRPRRSCAMDHSVGKRPNLVRAAKARARSFVHGRIKGSHEERDNSILTKLTTHTKSVHLGSLNKEAYDCIFSTAFWGYQSTVEPLWSWVRVIIVRAG